MTKRYIKRCLTSLVIRKLQIKTTLTHNFTPTRTVVIRKTDTSAREHLEKLETSHIASENVKSTETSEHSFAAP